MCGKHITIGLIAVIVVSLITAISIPNLVRYIDNKILISLPIILMLIAILILCISIVQIIRKGINKKDEFEESKRKNENIRMNLLKPILLILFGFFLSRIFDLLLTHPYVGKHAIPYYALFCPLLMATLTVGIIVGKKGWLFGLLIASIKINYWLTSFVFITMVNHHISVFKCLLMLIRSSPSFSILFVIFLTAGITGGFIGGLIRYLYDKIKKK